jgi:NADH dehydrogenase [ubiquinone] 1 alpha subcomplex assembly factor 7
MTPLAARLAARIARDGPIGVAAFMEACLNDPEHGYYRTRDAIGRAGDFITAPEISQAFGELIGLWCAVVWQQMGAPATLRLVELGPGRGSLMRDALRAARAAPDFRKALAVHLVETNASLEAQQRAVLQDADAATTWSDDLGAVPRGAPTIVIANEFLDTLPIAQWVLRNGHWHERSVGLDGAGRLAFVDGASDPAPRLPPALDGRAREGDIFETRDAALERLAATLATLGAPLAALCIDYGHPAQAYGDTLQAVRRHHYDDPLAAPGEADLTAQVDFAAVASAMQRCGLASDGPTTQAQFLGALGIAERASRLMAANPEKAARIETDVARLMAPGGMGTRFHAIGVRSANLAPLPGL